MADVRNCDKIVTNFLLNTCGLCQRLTDNAVLALRHCAQLATVRVSPDDQHFSTPLITGSVAEFYIQPMLSCIGDQDLMYHFSNELAIPAGTAPPTQLPDEFHSRVNVYEIVDSEFPGYVYLVSSYLLTECTDDGRYNAAQSKHRYVIHDTGNERYGPADVYATSIPFLPYVVRLAGTHASQDRVYCMRCLSWPPQADVWATRHRNYGWPDSATVDRVVNNGCDVVQVAHRQCRHNELMSRTQHRLSFSRAEIVLLNLSLIHI